MKPSPLVSVLVTSYNRAKYIEFAMDSILAQTYEHYEVIVSDNCSTDDTLLKLEKYKAHPKVRIFRNETNIGQFPNRNKAAGYATGKYLKYVDSDDYIYPTGLEVLVQMMEANPEAGWGLCTYQQFIEKPFPYLLSPEEVYIHNFLKQGIFHRAPLSSIFKKTVFDAIGGFKEYPIVSDFELWLRLGQEYPVLIMPDGIVWYRLHPEQELVLTRQYLKEYEKIKMHYLAHPNCPLSKKDIQTALSKDKKSFIREMIKSLMKLDRANFVDNFKCFQISLKPYEEFYSK